MATRFAQGAVSATDATNKVEDLAIQATMFADSAITSTSFTATPAQMINGQFRLSTQAAITLTTPTAAALVAALANVQVGSAFEFDIINANSGTCTVAAGTGVTLVGTTAVPTNKTQTYRGIVTNATAGAEAVSVFGRLTAPV